jgi:hypothetical protein
MKRKAIQIILVIAISFAIPVSSSYSLVSSYPMSSPYTIYYEVATGDFLIPALNIEDFDQENLLPTNLSKLKGSQSGFCFNEFQLATYLFRLSSYIPFQKSSLDQQIIILRC